MSTTTAQLVTPPAPWSVTFQEHVNALPSPEFVLGTIHPTPQSLASSTPTAHVPRVRYCIYRGMWATLPENKHNQAPRNPRVYESDMPTFTTDVRMEKVSDFFATSEGKADRPEQTKGSGGGGPVEAVWWNKDAGTQWRVKGRAFVVAPDIDSEEGKESSGVRTVKSEVGKRMRIVEEGSKEEGGEGEWSWSRELTGHFGNCSPGMRGTWKNPPPGTPTHGKEPDQDHQLGQKVTDLDDSIARQNFRVVVIKPDQVEQTYIGDPEKARRWRYTFVVEKNEAKEGVAVGGEKGEWKVEELWP